VNLWWVGKIAIFAIDVAVIVLVLMALHKFGWM